MTFELKIFLKDPERIRSMIKHFEPKHAENKTEHYVYFTDKDNRLHVLKDSNGALSYIVFVNSSPGDTTFTEVPVKSGNRKLTELRKKYTERMTFTKETTEYLLRDIKARFCSIAGLGDFLEVQTRDGGKQRLLEFIDNFDLSEKDTTDKKYYELMEERKHRRKKS